MSSAGTQKFDPRAARARQLEGLRKWRPSESHPVSYVKATVRSVYAQRLLDVAFYFTQRATYGLSVLVPIIGTKDQADQVEDILEGMMERIETDLRKEISATEQEKRNEGVNLVIDEYTKVLEENVPYYTPQARRFLGVLEMYDRICQLSDEMWMAGAWRRSKHDGVVDSWSKKIRAFSAEVNALHSRSLAAARRAKQARIAVFEERTAKDMQRAAKNPAEPIIVVAAANAQVLHEREDATIRAEESVAETYVAAAVEEDTRLETLVPDRPADVQPTAEVVALRQPSAPATESAEEEADAKPRRARAVKAAS